MTNRDRWIKLQNQIVFPIILLLYPLIHYNIGVDIADTGYSLGGFLFPNQMGEEWVTFSMYFANLVGRLLTGLPYGHTLMGMNLYTGLLVSMTALTAYRFFRKQIPSRIAFVGVFIAVSLCWCPTVILYNYLTYLFFTIAAVLLYQGLTKEKRLLLIIAGVMIGLNVMTRFPNIVETALILCVWYYGWLRHKKVSLVIQDTAWCLSGFVLGMGSILLLLTIQGKIGSYTQMIISLVTLGSSSADGHSVMDMLRSIIDAYRMGGKWMLYLLLTVLAGTFFLSVWGDRFRRIRRILYLAGILVLFRLLYGRGMFNFDYYNMWMAILQWSVIFIILSIVVTIWVLGSHKTNNSDKLLAALILMITLLTPLGSDNYLNQNINNLFLVAPFTLYWLWRFIKADITVMRGRFRVDLYALKSMLLMVLLIFMIQCFGFGVTFVFQDGQSGVRRDTKIEQNDVLRGMYTSKENAEALEGITAYCTEHQLIGTQDAPGSEVLLYGNIPAMSCFLHMPAALSTSWADLASYRWDTMQRDIQQIEQRKQEDGYRPVIIVSAQIGAWLSEDSNRMHYYDVAANTYEQDDKLKLIQDYIKDYSYLETYANRKFVLYQ